MVTAGAPVTIAPLVIIALSIAALFFDEKAATTQFLVQMNELVGKQGRPLDNVPYDAAYRRKMLPVYARRAIQRLAAG